VEIDWSYSLCQHFLRWSAFLETVHFRFVSAARNASASRRRWVEKQPPPETTRKNQDFQNIGTRMRVESHHWKEDLILLLFQLYTFCWSTRAVAPWKWQLISNYHLYLTSFVNHPHICLCFYWVFRLLLFDTAKSCLVGITWSYIN